MEQQDWQDIWQDLEDVYDKIREKKTAGQTPEERILNLVIDTMLDGIETAQYFAEANGAVPVEPDEDYGRCHCKD